MFGRHIKRLAVIATVVSGLSLTLCGIALADDDDDGPVIFAPLNINMCGIANTSPGVISGITPSCSNDSDGRINGSGSDGSVIFAPVNSNECGNATNSPGQISGISPTCSNNSSGRGKGLRHHR